VPSFDIVSEIDNQEVRNAVENASRELSTRYDFRGVNASFDWKEAETTMKAEGDFQLQQMLDMLVGKLVKRGVDPNTLDVQAFDVSGKVYTQVIKFKEGIDKETAKKIVKAIKSEKLKVQPAIQGEEVRVTGKKRDDLQTCIQFLKAEDFGQPLQFKNFRD